MTQTHRTFQVFEPKGEIAVVERPDRLVKVVFYPQKGDRVELVLEKDQAFNFAMEMLQHLYRLG